MCFSPTSFVSPHPSALRPLNYFDLPTSSRAAARPPAQSPHHLPSHRHFHRLECAATNVFAALVALCVHLFLCVVFTRCPPASHCRVSHRVSRPRHFSCARLLDLPLIAFADHPVDTIDPPRDDVTSYVWPHDRREVAQPLPRARVVGRRRPSTCLLQRPGACFRRPVVTHPRL